MIDLMLDFAILIVVIAEAFLYAAGENFTLLSVELVFASYVVYITTNICRDIFKIKGDWQMKFDFKTIKGTLLESLLDNFYEPQDYVDTLEEVADGEETLQDYGKRNDDFYDEEEIEFLRRDMEVWQDDLINMRDDWRMKTIRATGHEPTVGEIKVQEQIIIDWCKKYKLINGYIVEKTDNEE